MVIQQDNTRHQPRSTSSSIKPHRRLHRNTRTPNVSYHFRHTPQPPIFLPTTNTLPQSKPPVHKNAPHAFVGQPHKNHQNLDKHCLFVAVSRKTSPQIRRITAPKSIGFAAPPSGCQKTRRIGQCKHAPFILSRPFRAIYTARRAPYNLASI